MKEIIFFAVLVCQQAQMIFAIAKVTTVLEVRPAKVLIFIKD